jgi:hypothetical protein
VVTDAPALPGARELAQAGVPVEGIPEVPQPEILPSIFDENGAERTGYPASSSGGDEAEMTPRLRVFTPSGEVIVKDLKRKPLRVRGEEPFLPAETMGEILGLKIAWDPVEEKVTLTGQEQTIELWVGRPEAKVEVWAPDDASSRDAARRKKKKPAETTSDVDTSSKEAAWRKTMPTGNTNSTTANSLSSTTAQDPVNFVAKGDKGDDKERNSGDGAGSEDARAAGKGIKTRMKNPMSGLRVAPFLADGQVMVPVIFVARALGHEATWDPQTQEVTIKEPSDHSKIHKGMGDKPDCPYCHPKQK